MDPRAQDLSNALYDTPFLTALLNTDDADRLARRALAWFSQNPGTEAP